MVSQKITIEPVTRVEGHGKITINLKPDGKVDHAYFHVNEFRGFEKFCEGRMVFEMPTITPRICGICPVSHHLASAKAGDIVFGTPPPRTALLLRKLTHMGQFIQSHGMHFFELAGPDLILGFDADPAVRNVVGLIQADAGLTLKAVALRKYGQEIIHMVAGRRIHPNFAVLHGDQLPAPQAMQVVMGMVRRQQFVAARAIAQVERSDQVEILQQLQGAVDGGKVHRRTDALHLSMELLGRGVILGLMQHMQHHLALRRQPKAALAELFHKPILTTHSASWGTDEVIASAILLQLQTFAKTRQPHVHLGHHG